MSLFAVKREKLYVTDSYRPYIIIALTLTTPLIITIIIVAILVMVHRRRWVRWRKAVLSPSAAVQSQQSVVTSQAVLQQSLQPVDSRWELNPDMYVLYSCSSIQLLYSLVLRPVSTTRVYGPELTARVDG